MLRQGNVPGHRMKSLAGRHRPPQETKTKLHEKNIQQLLPFRTGYGIGCKQRTVHKEGRRSILQDGKRQEDPWRSGGLANKRRWMDVRHMASEGRFAAISSKVYVQHARNLHYIHQDEQQKLTLPNLLLGSVLGLWLNGPPGVGKSHRASQLAEPLGLFRKNTMKWWDGYENEPVVLIADLDLSHDSLAPYLKIWADRYAFTAEIKGSSLKIRPMYMIVTSNYVPEDIWPEDQQLLAAIRRRFVINRVRDKADLQAVTLPSV